MLDSQSVRRRDGRPLNNPFPTNAKGIGFIKGKLFSNLNSQIYAVGSSFMLQWLSDHGGSVCIYNCLEPNRKILSTVPGVAFVSAALSSLFIEECRGSVAVHDKIKGICRHQILENIRVLDPSVDHESMKNLVKDCQFGDISGPVAVLSGCLYSCTFFAFQLFEESLHHEFSGSKNSFYISKLQDYYLWDCGLCRLCRHRPISIRYSVTFFQTDEHDLQFLVNLDEPQMHMPSNPMHKESFHWPGIPPFGLKQAPSNTNRNKLKIPGKTTHLLKRKISRIFRKGKLSFPRLLRSKSGEPKLLEKNIGMEKFNIIVLTLSSEEDERFYGFGEQFSYMDMKGKRVPILVQEQGIGRGDQPITAAANLLSYRSGGDWSTTYAPSPFYMTSKMKCLSLEGYDYSVFDMRVKDRLQIQVCSSSMQGRILYGCSPAQLIERYTQLIGRMRELPEWILSGAVIGMQGGTEYVRHVSHQLQKFDVPISAFWLQDWVGQRKTSIGSQLWWNWEVDELHYCDWKQLVKDLRAKGIATMTYCNPCLVPTDEKKITKRKLFEEALNHGYLVQNKAGSPLIIPNTTIDVGMLDLTNPSACSWFKGILYEMVETGVRGWMADFGEGLPLDSHVYSGENAISAHNKYPELWAKVNREFVDEWKDRRSKNRKTAEGENGQENENDLVFFMRAGFRNSPRWATLFWEGDQMVSWQRNDGIKSSIVGLLSSGLSGYALNHSDIGGYCTVDLPMSPYRRTEELLMRWTELNSFTTIFRTHEGNVPKANVQFYSNERTLSHFARFAKVYKAWKFYRIELVKEAAEKGLPVVRHLFIHYPEDKYVQKITYQEFLVGTEILVVPVVDPGRNSVTAYFPGQQQWQHIWSGRIYGSPPHKNNGTKASVAASIGFPAVFVKLGSQVGATFLTNLKALGIL